MRMALYSLPALLLAACGVASGAARDTRVTATRSFSVGAYDAVSLEGSDDVRVVRGATASVSATGPEQALDLLDIRVERNTLKIGRKPGRNGWFRGREKGAVVTVVMPAIRAAGVAGSGNMTVDRADGASFGAAVEGSGNLNVASIAVGSVQLAAEGSGNLVVAGTAGDAQIAVEGSGDIDAIRLASKRAIIAADGSGGVRATVRERATIAVDGSGSVEVAGTANCAIVRNGSGSARCTP